MTEQWEGAWCRLQSQTVLHLMSDEVDSSIFAQRKQSRRERQQQPLSHTHEISALVDGALLSYVDVALAEMHALVDD